MKHTSTCDVIAYQFDSYTETSTETIETLYNIHHHTFI